MGKKVHRFPRGEPEGRYEPSVENKAVIVNNNKWLYNNKWKRNICKEKFTYVKKYLYK